MSRTRTIDVNVRQIRPHNRCAPHDASIVAAARHVSTIIANLLGRVTYIAVALNMCPINLIISYIDFIVRFSLAKAEPVPVRLLLLDIEFMWSPIIADALRTTHTCDAIAHGTRYTANTHTHTLARTYARTYNGPVGTDLGARCAVIVLRALRFCVITVL